MDDHYTLITGASAGIGKALAFECAARSMNILLVALPDTDLEKVAGDITKEYSVKTDTFAIDLTGKGAPEKVFNWTKELGYSVNILINNAGMGCVGPFEDYSTEFYYKMMCLNMLPVTLLTRLFIGDLKKLPESYVLNLGSMASFSPMPYKLVYAASKNFVYSFSRALREELRKTSVSVSVVCPGAVITNFQVGRRALAVGRKGRLTSLSPKNMASYTIRNLLKKRAVILPGISAKVCFYIEKVIPTFLKLRAIANVFNT